MKFTNKKFGTLKLQKGLMTALILSVLVFNVPQAHSANEPSMVPENWPKEWVVPFANEQETVVAQVAEPVVERTVRSTRRVTATAYSSDIRQTDASPFRPAMAMDFRDVVAEKGSVNCIAHNDLRLGTEVRFPDLHGDKVFTVCDRMNARYTGTGRIDFYFYVVGQDGRIDSPESLNAARANARAFGIKRSVVMEVLMPV